PFASIDDFVDRTRLPEDALDALGGAGAFDVFGGSRRSALWRTRGLARTRKPALPLPEADDDPAFAALDDFETIAWDYVATSLSPRGHPLEPLRESLAAQGLPDARTVAAAPHGSRIRYAGMVICRQRPATASGVVFMTLED